jgi:hypothetical protein
MTSIMNTVHRTTRPVGTVCFLLIHDYVKETFGVNNFLLENVDAKFM